MSGSPYASALGRFKALAPTFVPKETYPALVQARDLTEFGKLLDGTSYAAELVAVGATYAGAARFEVAFNRLFVQRNRLVLHSAPFAGKPLIHTYLRRWDIENIGLILASKAEGRTVEETEAFLVSDREFPAGLLAGELTLDDWRLLLQQPTVEAAVAQLVRFGYGATLLPFLEAYERTRDIFALLHALTGEYYRDLLATSRFFQGDEWVVREYLRSEIDVRNAMVLLKGRAADLPAETVLERFLEGGSALLRAQVPEVYATAGVEELVAALAGRFPALSEGLASYRTERSLVPFETALVRERAVRELKRLRTYPMSVATLFQFLLLGELERADLRRIVYGKVYGVPAETVSASLIVVRL